MDWKWLRNGYVAKSESQRGRDFRRILETAGYGPKGDSRATPAFLRSGNGCWKSAGMVMYRSHMHKGLKRNFQLMPGAQWLELLCHHIPDRFEHLVRYVGWYSTRCRGERARKAVPTAAVQAPEDAQVVAACARSAWARSSTKSMRSIRWNVSSAGRRELIARQFTTRLAPIAPAEGCAGRAKLT